MNGVDCRNFNNRIVTNRMYRLEYASYSKCLFEFLIIFNSDSVLVEDFTIFETDDTKNTLSVY